MGTWGVLAFDNDAANDWAYDLEKSDDLSHVEGALDDATSENDYLDSDFACCALAACEVLARLQGRSGYTNAYTKKVDDWVATHPLDPSSELLSSASDAINRILGENCELRALWDDSDGDEWRAAVDDLRRRLTS